MTAKITDWRNGCTLHEHGETLLECANDAKLNDAKLNDAKLNDAKLNWAELNWAELNWAKLNMAELNGAELNGAELNWAKLNMAELNGAELNGAELNGAKLNWAKLNMAKLNGAELKSANFHGADMRNCSRDDDAKIARLDVCEWTVTVQDAGIYIGCKQYTRAEIMAMTEDLANAEHSAAGIRWRRWGKALQALVIATLGEEKPKRKRAAKAAL